MMKCPYCGAEVVLRDAFFVYHTKDSHRYPKMWVCSNFPKCDAYVGCHKNTEIPLGRLANQKLRNYKQEAHKNFDPLWQSGLMTRREAYEWLSAMLHIKVEDCHIGMFDVNMCKETITICKRQSDAVHKAYSKKAKKRGKH